MACGPDHGATVNTSTVNSSWNIHKHPPLHFGNSAKAREGFVDESRVEGLSNTSTWRNQVCTNSRAEAWKHCRFTKVTEEDILQNVEAKKQATKKHVWVVFKGVC